MGQNASAKEEWEVGIPGCNLNMAAMFFLRASPAQTEFNC